MSKERAYCSTQNCSHKTALTKLLYTDELEDFYFFAFDCLSPSAFFFAGILLFAFTTVFFAFFAFIIGCNFIAFVGFFIAFAGCNLIAAFFPLR